MVYRVDLSIEIFVAMDIEAETEEEATRQARMKLERARPYFEAHHKRLLDEANMLDQAGGAIAN